MNVQNKFWSTIASKYLKSVNFSNKGGIYNKFSSCGLMTDLSSLKQLVQQGTQNQKLSFTFCKCARHYVALKQSVVSRITQDLDIDELKEKCKKLELKRGSRICMKDFVKKELDQRFDHAIENFSKEEERALKIIQLEHNFLFSEGYAIPPPEEMTSKNWLDVMTITTMEERLQHYIALMCAKVRQNNSLNARSNDFQSSRETSERCQSVFYDIENPELQVRWDNYRLASAMQHGISLVIDMDYADMNTSMELEPLCQQLWDMYCVNRSSPDPFHLIFTNCPRDNPIYRHLELHHMVESAVILATFTEESHTKLFPKHEMVYLSAQAKQGLTTYNPETVYILGAYYDPLVHKKGSFIRARQEKIHCVRLPIDEHVRWRHQASKDLDLNFMMSILLSVKAKQSWKEAFRSSIPMFVNQNAAKK